MPSLATRRVAALTPDPAPLRASRELRLLVAGNFVTGLGTQAALVARRWRPGDDRRADHGLAVARAAARSDRRVGGGGVGGGDRPRPGLVTSIWPALALLALAGAADSVSAVCRTTINQTVTPDAIRGRMSSVFSLVVTSGPRLGDVESGTVASLASPRFSVTSGGLACIAGVVLVVLAYPALIAFDTEDVVAAAPAPVPA